MLLIGIYSVIVWPALALGALTLVDGLLVALPRSAVLRTAFQTCHSGTFLSLVDEEATPVEAQVTRKASPRKPPKKKKNATKSAPSTPSHDQRKANQNHQFETTHSYESALEALRAYHLIHGDLVIPRRFVVPQDDRYPKVWHNVQLASRVYNMRWWIENVKQRPQRVEQLNEIGFVWQRLQPEWNLVLEALITFSSIHGHVMVPTKFVVPYGNENWPKATWGINLGNCVYRIRARNDFLRGSSYESRREQLDGLGFVWDITDFRFRTFYGTLRHFARLNEMGPFSCSIDGSAVRAEPLCVPSTYIVPQSPEWPRGVWGYPLGARCTAVRQKELYIKNHPDRHQMLDELGFHWSGNADFGWLRVSHAAAIYSRLHQRKLDVPYKFKVPSAPKDLVDQDEWPWPEYLWGLPLGQRLKDIRSKGAYLRGEFAEKRRRQLDALGFNWERKKAGRPKSVK